MLVGRTRVVTTHHTPATFSRRMPGSRLPTSTPCRIRADTGLSSSMDPFSGALGLALGRIGPTAQATYVHGQLYEHTGLSCLKCKKSWCPSDPRRIQGRLRWSLVCFGPRRRDGSCGEGLSRRWGHFCPCVGAMLEEMRGSVNIYSKGKSIIYLFGL
jgi:hypothetical protein